MCLIVSCAVPCRLTHCASRGGLEILFDNQTKHKISLSSRSATDKASPATVGDLVAYLVDNLIKDPRKELFVLDGSVYVHFESRPCLTVPCPTNEDCLKHTPPPFLHSSRTQSREMLDTAK